jgi:hypothetical protein
VHATPARHHGSRTAHCSAVSSSSHTARSRRFNQGGRPDLDRRPHSCATVPDSHRLRLSALPSGARAPWLRASKRTCHWQTQRLACAKHTTAGSHTQPSSAVMAQKPALSRPEGSGIRGCVTLAPAVAGSPPAGPASARPGTYHSAIDVRPVHRKRVVSELTPTWLSRRAVDRCSVLLHRSIPQCAARTVSLRS